jgi:hypothetical protein
MTWKTKLLFPLVVAAALAPGAARAHCDTLDGPVVKTAATALDTGKLEPVLAWVQPADEAEIRAAFERARTVRKAGKESRDLADRWFFETLVRVHRAGEGAGFEGIKPAGRVDPVVVAADRSIQVGEIEPLAGLIPPERLPELRARLARALALKDHDVRDVEAGRRWVAAYVSFVKYAEGEEHEHGDASRGHDEAARGHDHDADGLEASALVLAGHGHEH